MAKMYLIFLLAAIATITQQAVATETSRLFFNDFEILPEKCKHSLTHFETKILENELGPMFEEFAKNMNLEYKLHKEQIPKEFAFVEQLNSKFSRVKMEAPLRAQLTPLNIAFEGFKVYLDKYLESGLFKIDSTDVKRFCKRVDHSERTWIGNRLFMDEDEAKKEVELIKYRNSPGQRLIYPGFGYAYRFNEEGVKDKD